MRLRIVVLVVVMALIVSACTSGRTVPPSKKSRPAAVDLSATPAGWVPIAYGDAQVSVPPTWLVFYRQSDCATIPPGLLVIQPPEGRPWCGPGISFANPAQRPKPPKSIVTLDPQLGTYHLPAQPSIVIHGIALYSLSRGPRVSTVRYLVPALKVIITTTGRLSRPVLDTLSPSPRAAVLSEGAPQTPVTWRWQEFDGLRFATPATWPTRRTDQFSSCRSFIALGGRMLVNQVVEPDEPMVELDTDSSAYISSCPAGVFQESAPGNGVQIDAGSARHANLAPARSDRAIRVNGVVAYIDALQPFDILDVLAVVPGRSMPLDVQIGLAGNGMIARTILYSLRAA